MITQFQIFIPPAIGGSLINGDQASPPDRNPLGPLGGIGNPPNIGNNTGPTNPPDGDNFVRKDLH